MKSPIALLSSHLESVQRLEPDVRGLSKDLETLEQRYKDEGYGFLSVALPTLCKALDKGLSSGELFVPRGFSVVHGRGIPKLFSGIFKEIFDDRGHLLESPSISAIKILREILMFWKKIPSTDIKEEILDYEAKVGFYGSDSTARLFQMPGEVEFQLHRVRPFILHALHKKSVQNIRPKHGPGAVYEGLSQNQKWTEIAEMASDGRLDLDYIGFDFLSDGKIPSDGSQLDVLYPSRPVSSGVARLVSVPKSSTARRTITVEPVANQFLQQGLRSLLIDSINECYILNRCMRLDRQELNQELALNGSRTGDWATIDLKSASDLLSNKLVEECFGLHTSFLEALMVARSSHVECEGFPTTRLWKFAGMGNATTFPVQSVVFSLVAIAAIVAQDGVKPSKKSVARAADMIQVYGDDIIVHKDYVHQVVYWLTRAGLIVNTDKSFLEGNFKESCGVDAFRGYDVTPVYIKCRPDTSLQAKDIAGLVALSNSTWMRGLYEVSNWIRQRVEDCLGKRLPLVSSTSGALGLHSRIECQEIHRWNSKLHRYETKVLVLRSRSQTDVLTGVGALLKFYLTPLLGRGKDHLKRTDRRRSSSFAWRWVPSLA